MRIGNYQLYGRIILAPMAGVTDRPFRILCRRFGASLAVSEMISANPDLQSTRKTLLRSDHAGEPEPRIIQILGACPQLMAEAAKLNVGRGAQIIDINMGCPAKKVCNVAAGSALLRDEKRVKIILEAVVKAVDVPVTLKLRTGWDLASRNAVNIAKIAECCGIQAVTIHGRTRACGFSGKAEYNTIAETKLAVKIPVIANGDIDSPAKAKHVLEHTGADALMIGRAALGKPWLFKEINDSLDLGLERTPIAVHELLDIMIEHLSELYAFYGEYAGVRIARKHIGWYVNSFDEVKSKGLSPIFSADNAEKQISMVKKLFQHNFRENPA
ncbi:MAG: tRNA dihydrouridine synthase DusB [Candidatus Methylumidiphilus sp.]